MHNIGCHTLSAISYWSMGLWPVVLLPSQKQRERGMGSLAGVLPPFFPSLFARSFAPHLHSGRRRRLIIVVASPDVFCLAASPLAPPPIPLLCPLLSLSPLSRFALSSTLSLQRDQGKSGVAGNGGPSTKGALARRQTYLPENLRMSRVITNSGPLLSCGGEERWGKNEAPRSAV